MTHRAQAPHLASCLAVVDLLTVLYDGVLEVDPRRPDLPGRDRFVLSHAAATAAHYATLAESGFFPSVELERYATDGALLTRVASSDIPGVEVSSVAPGQGLAIGVGLALACAAESPAPRVLVVVGDEECDEGTVGEAASIAGSLGLDNLAVFVDANITPPLENDKRPRHEILAERFRSYGWSVHDVDGHDYAGLKKSFSRLPITPGIPVAVIGETVKGAGISLTSNQPEFDRRALTRSELRLALDELEEFS